MFSNIFNSTSDSRVEESSISTAEKARHLSTREKITFHDKFTPNRFPDDELNHDSLQSQPNFLQDLANMEPPGDYLSEVEGRPISIDAANIRQISFDLSTPSRIGEFVSPMKQQQAFSNLDYYFESVKKGEQIIFQESESEEDEQETVAEKRARGEARRRRRARRVEPAVELQTRWDYDERTNIQK